ncbi:hypothetical protein EJ08DRAFT_652608 [Tothia fuscella]|uniref:EKC/KEOPS complex subunit BUD32 n=1 Tax=Tothia fuscella TaxID=1048955 RepID=A0A9P4NJW8_9PEZI|nr:hypothetical protein EJ08DRAFT_652608 [Tothia fuscella]
MIDAGSRFFVSESNFVDWKPDITTEFFDFDQRRTLTIKGLVKQFPPFEDKELPVIARHIDNLSPSVHTFAVDEDGLLVGVSTDEKDDFTWFIPYPRFFDVESLAGCRTVMYSKLTEIDRLGPGIDRCCYEDDNGLLRYVAFKYTCIEQIKRREMAWVELQTLKNLPPHANLLLLDRVVLEDVESRVIGFTTSFICGGTLEDNPTTLFRFEWLQQLTSVVDFLNLELGIMHQDIAPRNIFIDSATQGIRLFEFDWAARGKLGLMDGRDDVTGVIYTLYEVITGNDEHTHIPHWERDVKEVFDLPEWPVRRELDRDVSIFRNFLNEWVAKREADGGIDRYLSVPQLCEWPPIAEAEDLPYMAGSTDADGKLVPSYGPRYRRDAIKNGQYLFRWERPPQCRLPKKE